MTPRQIDTLHRQLAWAVAHGDRLAAIWLGQRIRRARMGTESASDPSGRPGGSTGRVVAMTESEARLLDGNR
jgi:hypothetical protein